VSVFKLASGKGGTQTVANRSPLPATTAVIPPRKERKLLKVEKVADDEWKEF
jgi:hypothetical protein